jgi:phosphoribosylformylglycinamidine synthase
VSAAEPTARLAVVTFPGSNDDRDAALALELLGAEAVPVWHAATELPEVGAVVLPGGFSYGDYLRAGALARFAPIMEAVRSFAAAGGLVLGICNGFQVLCEAGLLPGVLRPNQSLQFVCRDAAVTVERADTAFTSRCAAGQRLTIPVKHAEGCYFADNELLARLEAERLVLLRYRGESPNGSVANIAGIVSADGNVMGLMPHPEHAVDPLSGSSDGALVLGSLVDSVRERAFVGAGAAL